MHQTLNPSAPSSSVSTEDERRYPQFADLRHYFPTYGPEIIFDVGSNTGQSIDAFARSAPCAQIYAFEPALSSFEVLKTKYSQPNCELFNFALYSETGERWLEESPLDSTNHVAKQKTATTRLIKTERGDIFCATREISNIDFLKIDTEGADLEVCRGFSEMFKTSRIAAVQVEAGMNKGNAFHTPLRVFQDFMDSFSYELFFIYEQTISKRKVHLRRCNPLFVSPALRQSPSPVRDKASAKRNAKRALMRQARDDDPQQS